jgi:hypothetical protein
MLIQLIVYLLATCREISTIQNGRVIGNGKLEGDEITFICDENHAIVGQKVLQCTEDGQWNASIPKCQGTPLWKTLRFKSLTGI